MCVRLCGSTRMDYSDDEDFCLSQNSVKPFNQTQSSGYGEDVIDGYNQVVSLESGEVANFNLIWRIFVMVFVRGIVRVLLLKIFHRMKL